MDRSVSTSRSLILDQLSFLLDELEAQRPWLLRIPVFQLEAKPMESAPSLFEMYVNMSRQEWEVHVAELGGPSAPVASLTTLSGVIDHIQKGRRSVLEMLQRVSDTDWETATTGRGIFLAEYAFQITQSDGNFLKAIAERLHESVIKFDK